MASGCTNRLPHFHGEGRGRYGCDAAGVGFLYATEDEGEDVEDVRVFGCFTERLSRGRTGGGDGLEAVGECVEIHDERDIRPRGRRCPA